MSQLKSNKSYKGKNKITTLNILLPISLKNRFKAACAIRGEQFSIVLRKHIMRYANRVEANNIYHSK